MNLNESDINRVIGSTLYGSGGEKIGTVGQVYFDDVSGRPEWVTVQTGFFGTNESFVPVANAQMESGGVRVPYDKDLVKNAPNVDVEQGHLSEEEEERLFRHYSMDYGHTAVGDTGRGTVGHDTSGPTTDDAMTRSEEQLRVGTTAREAGRARLRKYIVSEQQTVNVPVSREEVRVVREPITEANVGSAMSGPDLSEEEHEVVLHEEQVVVDKKAVPVERVRMDKETVTEERQVTEEVRKERIETEGVEGREGRERR